MPEIRLPFAMLLLGLLALSQSACSGTRVGTYSDQEYNAHPLTVAIPDGIEDAAALTAAESALVGRGWEVVNKSDHQITGKLRHRQFDATVNIKIEGRNLVLYSDSTYLDTQTKETKPAVPYGWLKNLQEDMQKFIDYEKHRIS